MKNKPKVKLPKGKALFNEMLKFAKKSVKTAKTEKELKLAQFLIASSVTNLISLKKGEENVTKTK